MKVLLVTLVVLVTFFDLGATFNIARAKRSSSMFTNAFRRQQNITRYSSANVQRGNVPRLSVEENTNRLHKFILTNFAGPDNTTNPGQGGQSVGGLQPNVPYSPSQPDDGRFVDQAPDDGRFPDVEAIDYPIVPDDGRFIDQSSAVVVDPNGPIDQSSPVIESGLGDPGRSGGSSSSRPIYDVNDVIVVLDSSGSIGVDEFIKAKQLVASLIGELPTDISNDKTRIACISFSDFNTINTEFGFMTHSNKPDVLQAINRIQYQDGGSTHTTAALERAKQLFETDGRSDSHKVLFIATDGHSNGGGNPAIPANAMKNRDRLGVSVFVIAVSDDVNRREVEAIASRPSNKNIMYVSSFTEATYIIDAVNARINNQN